MALEKNVIPEAEEEVEETNEGAEPNAGAETAEEESAGLNIEEAQRIGSKRSERAERSAVASYFKQQGLSEEEVAQALEAYKQRKEELALEQRNNLSAMQARVDEYEANGTEKLREANLRFIRAEAMVQAINMGVDTSKLDYAIRLADLRNVQVDEEGNVDGVEIKSALQQVLTDIPELKGGQGKDEEERTGFKVGAPGSVDNESKIKDQLSAIFGNTNE